MYSMSNDASPEEGKVLLEDANGHADYSGLRESSCTSDTQYGARRSMWRSLENSNGDVLMWARVITAITSIADGYGISVISGAAVLAQNEFGFGTEDLGWLLGAAHLAGAFAAPMASTLGDEWGRRPAFVALFFGVICGSLIMAFSRNYQMLLVGRIVEGVSLGAGVGTVMTYMSEISPSEHRGHFGSSEGLLLMIGVMLGYCSNEMFREVKYNWRVMLALGGLLPLLGLPLLIMGLVPESPRFLLVTKGASRQSALIALVGEKEAALTLSARRTVLNHSGFFQTEMATWTEVFSPEVRTYGKRLLLAIGVLMLQGLSGNSFVMLAATGILTNEIGQATATKMVLGMGVLQVVCCAIGSMLVEHVGRRPLLLVSCAGSCVFSIAVGEAYMRELPVVPWKLAGLSCFTAFYQLGLGPVCYCYTSEILPNRIRSKGIGLATLATRIYSGGSVAAFVMCAQTYSPALPFFINGSLSFIGFVFVCVCLPETRGVLLENMHRLFVNGDEQGLDISDKHVSDSASGDALSDISESGK